MKTFSMEDIEKDPEFIKFIEAKDVRETTATKYVERMRLYCNYTGKSPTELIDEAEGEEEERIRMRKRKIEKYLSGFVKYLKDEKRAPSYIRSIVITVRNFYRTRYIELPNTPIRLNNHDTEPHTTAEIIQKSHIREVLNHCILKYQATILLMSSSGMGSAEIRHLTWQNFLDAISDYYKPTVNEQFDIDQLYQKLHESDGPVLTWKIRRFKTGMPYITFNTPEATYKILDYLEERWDKNKAITSSEGYLFESRGRQMKASAMSSYFKDLNERLGYGKVGKQRFLSSHKLRKYFASTLNKNKVPETFTHWLLGHKIDPVTDAYFKADVPSLKKQYISIIKEISIGEVKVKTIESPEYQELKKKYINDSKVKDDKIASLEKRMELMEQLLSDNEFKKDIVKNK